VKEDLDRVYEVFPWKMRPNEEEARARSESIVKLFKNIIDFPKEFEYSISLRGVV